MSARRKHAAKRQSARPKRKPSNTGSPAARLRQISSTVAAAEKALEECTGAICLVEVTLHSLKSQEIASTEQEVLKRALKTIWRVHDWLGALTLNDLAEVSTGRKDES
jgi:hypothetical protein